MPITSTITTLHYLLHWIYLYGSTFIIKNTLWYFEQIHDILCNQTDTHDSTCILTCDWVCQHTFTISHCERTCTQTLYSSLYKSAWTQRVSSTQTHIPIANTNQYVFHWGLHIVNFAVHRQLCWKLKLTVFESEEFEHTMYYTDADSDSQ